jgi:hypothetical protein
MYENNDIFMQQFTKHKNYSRNKRAEKRQRIASLIAIMILIISVIVFVAASFATASGTYEEAVVRGACSDDRITEIVEGDNSDAYKHMWVSNCYEKRIAYMNENQGYEKN